MPAEPAVIPAVPRRAGLGRALRHRNYRLYFVGQAVSLLGTWTQQVAMGWLVYRLRRDARLLGAVSFAGQVPSLLLLPLAGVLLDRRDRLRLVMTTQVLALLQAFALAALTLSGVLVVWQVILLAVLLGCINAFDLPGRQALLPGLVPDKDDLTNAIALNSSLFNGARFLGPVLAGLLIWLAPPGDGEGWCFLVNGLSYLAVLAALWRMDLPPRAPDGPARPLLHGLAEGVRYAFGSPPIRAILLMVAWLGFVAMPYLVVLPVVAEQMLGGGSGTYAILVTSSGVGALAGGIYLASRQGIDGAGRRIVFMSALLGAGLVALSLTRVVAMAAPLLVLVGFGMMLAGVSCNTVVQTLVADDKRGRVMSLFTLAFLGTSPFGSLLAGELTARWGAPLTLLLCGAGCLAGALCFALRFPHRRLMHPPLAPERRFTR
jgi:MFS family permease